ncbi:MAG: zinc ribbon domain-containing protein, partial [Acetatifactor sp.]|nr:zinc ribbon domain-containing protein [Acetatifactor sp.]
MFCNKCGVKLDDDAIFCPACGTKVRQAAEEMGPVVQNAEPAAQ